MNLARSNDQLAAIERSVWKDWGLKRITDVEAQFLSDAIGKMKSTGASARSVGALAGRLGGRFVSRQKPRDTRCAPEEAARRKARRERRRVLAGSSALPPSLRHHFTETQRAVLYIMATEVAASGECKFSIKEIGDMAGACRTTVQTTQHEARRLGLIEIFERPQRGRKSLTNVIKIVSKEWLAWLKRGPRRALPDRVQSADTYRGNEPLIEVRGIEEGKQARTSGASADWIRPGWRRPQLGCRSVETQTSWRR